MSLIDWSDPEVMLSLLLEYVEDERHQSHADAGRWRFLGWLVREIAALEERCADLTDTQRMAALRSVAASVHEEFRDDPVVEHVEACLEELARISARSRDP